MGGTGQGPQDIRSNVAGELGVADSVRFAGFLDMAAKRAEGDGADVFINTNRVDNQPVSVIEACAMGLPVVATNVGGIPDLLRDRETGLLVRDGDHAAMAEAVIDLLEDPELAERLSRQGRAGGGSLGRRRDLSAVGESSPVRDLNEWRSPMCGIVGLVRSNRDAPIDPGQFTRMRDSLEHRGPDDSGQYLRPGVALGSRRLSIVDLSPRGHMPMATADGRYWIVYNGEVYNFRELRAGLEAHGETSCPTPTPRWSSGPTPSTGRRCSSA